MVSFDNEANEEGGGYDVRGVIVMKGPPPSHIALG